MRLISSSQNPEYKQLKQLATSSKARRDSDQTVLEGIHLAEQYLYCGGVPNRCAVSESAMNNPEVEALLSRMDELQVTCLVFSDAQYKALSVIGGGVGLLLVITVPKSDSPATMAESSLLLDDVQDPGNVGTILRSAAAAGIEHIYCSSGTASVWSPKVLRSGMGAQFTLKLHENIDLAALISNATIPVLATSLDGTATIYETDLSQPVAWIFGNEGQGVSADLLGLNVQKVIIPQVESVESLNVSAAAAVCLFEQRRQTTHTK